MRLRRFLCSSAVALVAAAALLPASAYASACPFIKFSHDYPRDEELPWSENVQGVAHDATHWFFTTTPNDDTTDLIKLPVGTFLADDPSFDGTEAGGTRRTIPKELSDLGFNHYGDIDQVGGFIIIALEKQSSPQREAMVAFRTSDLSLAGWLDVSGFQTDGHFGWVAYNPADGLLYTSGNEVSSTEPLHRYTLDVGVLQQTQDLAQAVSYKDDYYLHESDGSDLARPLRGMQGGTFTPWGDFFIENGYYDEFPLDFRGGIHLFGPDSNLIVESTNGSGDFNFAYNEFDDEEPEGIDWWDRDTGPRSPGVTGQLHAVMIDNTTPIIEDPPDDLYFKHYTVDYSCKSGLDSDGDGLNDYDEVAVYGTNQNVADTDGDGLNDGDEVSAGTDPLKSDTDADGLSDGAEVGTYGTSPVKADTDGDGVNDGAEVTAGTDPLTADTDGDGLNDGDEASQGTDPLVADSDGDGLTDGAEVHTHHTDPLNVDTDADGLNDGTEVASGTDPLTADSDGDGISDGEDPSVIAHVIATLPPSSFKPPARGTANSMLNSLDKIQALIKSGKTGKALKNIASLRTHLDGCGATPDRGDWIVNCTDQLVVRNLLDTLAENVST